MGARGKGRAKTALASPPAFSLAVLAVALAAWYFNHSCKGVLEEEVAVTLGPIPPFLRPRASLEQQQPLLDIVYVSAFPSHLRSSLRSLCHFFDGGAGLGSVHLVVPDRMVAYFESSLPQLQCPAGQRAHALAFRVWGESSLIPAFTQAAPYKGTLRQMTLKLAAATIVGSPFYLVMDSDVYARRPFGVGDLLLQGEAGKALRARTGLDQLDFSQPSSWFRDSARLLQTPLVADTDAYCAAAPGGGAPAWFAATGNATPPAQAPFALLPVVDPRERGGAGSGRQVYGACRNGRGHATHVTPMVLSAELVKDVLFPRLEAAAAAGGAAGSPWYAALLNYQASREAQCWQGVFEGLGLAQRFYSWTEYSLYFVAGVASAALDQYHAFPASGGITSYKYSLMLPQAYDAADWDATFLDAGDSAPFFIVHSWFNKPLQHTNARLAKYIPSLAAEEEGEAKVPVPSALPLY